MAVAWRRQGTRAAWLEVASVTKMRWISPQTCAAGIPIVTLAATAALAKLSALLVAAGALVMAVALVLAVALVAGALIALLRLIASVLLHRD